MSLDFASTSPTPWEWALPAGQARRVAASARPRWLQVTGGKVWLTATLAEGAENPDRWLEAGARLWLAAGSEWVAEGEGDVRYTLLEAPALAARLGLLRPPQSLRSAGSAVRSWARRLSFTQVPPICV